MQKHTMCFVTCTRKFSSALAVYFFLLNIITYVAAREATGKFLHITDFHPDWYYRAGTAVQDMCHVAPRDLASVELTEQLSFESQRPKILAGPWGPPPGSECDTPIALVNATFSFIYRELVQNQGGLDFVIWTGDNARHDNDNRYPRTLNQIYSSNDFMTNKMQQIFGHDKYSDDFVPVVPTLGNNDVYPHNIMFAGPKSKTISSYKSMWKAWIPPEQSHTFDRGAYFHMSVASHLSVISLNTLYFYENNKAVDDCIDPEEPGSLQLEWLEIQLELFRRQNRKAWIIGHIPPTDRQWYDRCYNRYAAIVIRFRDLIVGQLYGHVNIDHFYFVQYPHTGLRKSDAKLNTTGKSPVSMLQDIRQAFNSLPRPVSGSSRPDTLDRYIGHLAVINVSPSVVPNYFPSLRVFSYELASDDSSFSLATSYHEAFENQPSLSDEDRPARLKKKHKKKKKKRRKKRPALPPVTHLGPAYMRQRYTPLGYTQYFLNTTRANKIDNSTLSFEVEYDTSTWPYDLPDLTVNHWLGLAEKISGRTKRKTSKLAACATHYYALVSGWLYQTSIQSSTKHESKLHKTIDAYWEIFLYRAFVSTGAEDYQ